MASVGSEIEAVRRRIEKKYKAATELFPDFTVIKEIPVIPSPSSIINAVTGIGGIPRGRVTEIYGPYSSGKTTIAIEICAEAQRRDPNAVALFMDYEHAFDAAYAKKLGLDLSKDRFIYSQPEYFEQGANIIDSYVDAGLVDIVVVDSAAAMTPRAELEGEWDKEGGTQKGMQAMLMAQFLTKMTVILSRGRKPALVLINQTRANIQIGGRPNPGAPKEKPAGGKALTFYTSIRLELEIVRSEGDENRGTKGTDQIYTQNKVRVTAVKNKLAPPFVRGILVIEYGKGINNILSIAELAEARLGIMSGSGFFKYEGDTTETSFSCRGREVFQEILTGNPALQNELEQKVLDSIREDQAKALGLDSIKKSGKAKEITGTVLKDDSEDEEQEDPEGPGLPLEDEE